MISAIKLQKVVPKKKLYFNDSPPPKIFFK